MLSLSSRRFHLWSSHGGGLVVWLPGCSSGGWCKHAAQLYSNGTRTRPTDASKDGLLGDVEKTALHNGGPKMVCHTHRSLSDGIWGCTTVHLTIRYLTSLVVLVMNGNGSIKIVSPRRM